jgi:hypothetical protein
MSDKYILIGQTPVLEPDLLTWAYWFETAGIASSPKRKSARAWSPPCFSAWIIDSVGMGPRFSLRRWSLPMVVNTARCGGARLGSRQRRSTRRSSGNSLRDSVLWVEPKRIEAFYEFCEVDIMTYFEGVFSELVVRVRGRGVMVRAEGDRGVVRGLELHAAV